MENSQRLVKQRDARSTLPWLHVMSEVPPGGPSGHGITLARVLDSVVEEYRLSACYEKVGATAVEVQGVEAALALELFSLPPHCKSHHLVCCTRWLHQAPAMRRLEETLTQRRNGVVLATPVGHAALFRAGLTVAWKLGIPTAIWVMDDWSSVIRQRYPYLRKSADSFMRMAVNKSSALFAISPEMAQLFEARWGGTWQVLVNYIPAVPQRPPAKDNRSPSGELRIGFFGDVYAGQADALLCFSQACLRNGCALRVYGSVDGRFRQLPWGDTTTFLGRVRPDQAQRLMLECDVLYLPFGFEPQLKWFVTTSFPTKIADYAATGLPVIVHGPPDSTIVRFAKRHRWGVVVESLVPAELDLALMDIEGNYAAHVHSTYASTQSIEMEIGEDVVCNRFRSALQGVSLRSIAAPNAR